MGKHKDYIANSIENKTINNPQEQSSESLNIPDKITEGRYLISVYANKDELCEMVEFYERAIQANRSTRQLIIDYSSNKDFSILKTISYCEKKLASLTNIKNQIAAHSW